MEEDYTKSNKKFLDTLSPRSAFKVGLLSSLGLLFAIGFFIMLAMMIGNGPDTEAAKNTDTGKTKEQTMTISKISKNDWIRGDKKAKISIFEYSDVNCPFCERFHETTKQLLEKYDGQVNLIFRNFPLAQLHPESPKMAEAAECIGDLGGNEKFWEFLDKVFAKKTTLANLSSVVSSIGLDASKVQQCMDAGKYTQKIQAQIKEAADAGRIGCPRGVGTPFSIIVSGDTKIPVCGALPIEQISKNIDSLIK